MTMANIHHFDSFSIVQGDIRINIDLDPLSQRFNKAQYELDAMIMADMKPYMPFATGGFIQRTDAVSASLRGTGVVCAGVPPMGRYLYEGKVMVDSATGRGPMKITSKFGEETLRFRKGAKLRPTDRPLQYSNGRTDHWFDAAKSAKGADWVRITKKTAGGG